MSEKTLQISISLIVLSVIMIGSGFALSHYGLIELGGEQNGDNEFIQPTINVTGDTDGNLLNNLGNADVLDSTATVYTTTGRSDDLSSIGSAFMYTDQHLITNEHVVEGNEEVFVKYGEGTWSEADVIGTDIHSDIAVLRPEDVPEDSQPLPLQETLPEVGETVVAIGSPKGLDDSVSTGIVSGTERSVKIQTPFAVPDSIQTDAALNPGNSGGPLISTKTGAVVGINRATEGENIGQAVSSRMADTIAQSLIETGDHEHSYIGIVTLQLNPLTQSDYNIEGVDGGLVVSETFNGTPGSENFQSAQSGDPDIIVGVDDESTEDNEDLASYLMRETQPGEEVDFEIYRDGEYMTISVNMSSRSEASNV
jgi:serine protease Do